MLILPEIHGVPDRVDLAGQDQLMLNRERERETERETETEMADAIECNARCSNDDRIDGTINATPTTLHR